MNAQLELLRLNRELDSTQLHEQFARDGRVQVRDLLETEAANRLARLLIESTPWGLAWRAGDERPHLVRREEMAKLDAHEMQAAGNSIAAAVRDRNFAYIYSQYPASDAATERWSTSGEHDLLVTELNHPQVLDFVRAVSGFPEITWCTAQVTHFGPTQFLSMHQDLDGFHGDNRLVAYVLNLPPSGWWPDWGGYLNFFNEEGDIIHGYAPRFNSLNMFRVPQLHNVSYVTPFAAADRLAVTGWFRSGVPALSDG
jgi:SM-20-related protein